MKIYKNPFVLQECYFVKTGKAKTGRNESAASKGYDVWFSNGKWKVKEAQYYDYFLRHDMPVVAKNNTSIQKVIEKVILNSVLDLVYQSGEDCRKNG